MHASQKLKGAKISSHFLICCCKGLNNQVQVHLVKNILVDVHNCTVTHSLCSVIDDLK